MISICIPIYNYNSIPLISHLKNEALLLNVPIEIVCIDDCSNQKFKEENEKINQLADTYILLNKNVGRSKIRNLLASIAKYEWLIFLDCDSTIINNSFIENYINEIKNTQLKVFYGGTIYPNQMKTFETNIHWKLGHFRESPKVNDRQKNSYKTFHTNNFLIHKSVFNNIQFNESLQLYGHEDTLFSYDLMKNNIGILHIDNSVLNNNLATNSSFLLKLNDSINNLLLIQNSLSNAPDFDKMIGLLNYHNNLSKFKKNGYHMIYKTSKPLLILCIKNGFAPLNLIDFYKLAKYMELKKKFNK